ncbi:uncharacterized protein LOC105025908 [Esox lucius]|uniref:uncharacterized protein LOC105025908 n=1 Tax=Esox lucius TaxID=8010 RepID=UPI001476BB1F|nr:uncharacterized protein LOC105025908 [Esox lucius]
MEASTPQSTGSDRSQVESGHHQLKMDPVERYGGYESGRQPEKNQSLHWCEVKEEAEECAIQQSQRSSVSLRVESSQVLPSPVLVKEESEETSLQPEDKEKSLITVKKEENEDWLKSDDEDVVKVTVPWEALETSPTSSGSDTEDSEMEGDAVQVAASSNKKKRCEVCGPKKDRKTQYTCIKCKKNVKTMGV